MGLSYVDLLYAVPVAELGTLIARTGLQHVKATTWTDVAVALAAVTFGWVGHHRNRELKESTWAEPRPKRPFTSLWILQFLSEVAIIGAYFAIVARLDIAGGGTGPSERWKLWWLAALFALYFAWDVLDILIAEASSESVWAERARTGAAVTVGFATFYGVLALVFTTLDDPPQCTVAFNIVVLGLLYAYRGVQERCRGATQAPPSESSAQAETHRADDQGER